MLEVVGQDIISGNMGFIGTDPDRLYRMGVAEKTEDVTVTGNPAVLDNATGKPFRDLHIYGRSEQVTTTGAQLLDLGALELRQETGATINRLDDGGFLVNGTPKAAYEQYTRVFTLDLEPGTYYISGGEYSAGCAVAQIKITNADGTKIYRNNREFDVLGTEKEISIIIQSTSTDPIDNYKVYPMLNKGSIALPFEPYTGGKPSPSPDYPQEIVNAGGDGSLNVMVRGKNLISPNIEWGKAGWGGTVKNTEGVVIANAVNGWGVFAFHSPAVGKTVTLSITYRQIETTSDDVEDAFAVVTLPSIDYPKSGTLYTTMSPKTEESKINVTFTSDEYIGVLIRVSEEGVGLMRKVELRDIQLEESSKPTAYEPYYEPQSMSVTTPNGLPGIQVSSGGNYTDENGQQWICDEVDFGRGVYVQRINLIDLTDCSWKEQERIADDYVIFSTAIADIEHAHPTAFAGLSNKHTCSKYNYYNSPNNYDSFFLADWFSGVLFKSSNSSETEESVRKKMNGALLYYMLATPIETPLTASEIAAYKSLRTYKGTTIVEAEDKAGISVTYKRSAKTDNTSAERKIEESEKKEYDES